MTKLAKMWNNKNTQMLLVGMSKRYNCEEVKDAYKVVKTRRDGDTCHF